MGIALRGLEASAAHMPTSSAPRKEKTAFVKTFQNPRNLPPAPSEENVRNGIVES